MNASMVHRQQQAGRREFFKVAGVLAAAGAAASVDTAQAAPAGRRNLHKYEELFPEEFYEVQQRAPIVYLPIGEAPRNTVCRMCRLSIRGRGL